MRVDQTVAYVARLCRIRLVHDEIGVGEGGSVNAECRVMAKAVFCEAAHPEGSWGGSFQGRAYGLVQLRQRL